MKRHGTGFTIDGYDLHPSPNIIRVIKSRTMRTAGHVGRTGHRRGPYRVLVGKPEEKRHFEDLDVDERVLLNWSSRSGMWWGGVLSGLIWLGIGAGRGLL
jgi:hypothetical protein